jgi:K(+)-stimulated pyrophosphate-energized sodium pump
MLGGYMAGVTVSGVLWAVFQNNAGGAWDNAKKSFEAGVMINGEMTFKGSDAHKAAVTGDTVGDPFKDTSGPSMNILIKLTCLIGLVIAPILGSGHSDNKKASCCASTEKYATMTKEECAAKGCTEANCTHSHDANYDINHKDSSAVVTQQETQNIQIKREVLKDGKEKATVNITTTVDGKETKAVKVLEGTKAEVDAKIADLDKK